MPQKWGVPLEVSQAILELHSKSPLSYDFKVALNSSSEGEHCLWGFHGVQVDDEQFLLSNERKCIEQTAVF